VHISAKLHCLRPDRNFKFHFCQESRIVYLYICVVIVTMTSQSYNLTSRNSLPKHRKWCYIFVHFSSTPTSILNLTISSESQWNIDSNDVLSIRKYSQLFTQKSNAMHHSVHSNQWDWVLTDTQKWKH